MYGVKRGFEKSMDEKDNHGKSARGKKWRVSLLGTSNEYREKEKKEYACVRDTVFR